nr:tetratricopeptide repeat protein [Pseudodesulfovibrio sp.]
MLNLFMGSLIILFLAACTNSMSSVDVTKLEQSANSGNYFDQYKLALLYEKQQNFKEAFNWYLKSAKGNNKVAKNILGNYYLEGRGTKKNYKKAFNWYEKSSNDGYFDGINNLGYMYDLGKGVKKDKNKASQLYERAALKGSIRAMYNLGISYKYGQGVDKNLVQAYKWLDLVRFYTGFSKDMNLKWSSRKCLDELSLIMTAKEIEEAKELGNVVIKNIEWFSEEDKN